MSAFRKLAIGNLYIKNDLNLLIVGRDDDIDNIYFISITVNFKYIRMQCTFIPIEVDRLIEFVDEANYCGNFNPSSLDGAMEAWTELNNGEKLYFKLSPLEIWESIIGYMKNSKSPIACPLYNGILLTPIIFPKVKNEHESTTPDLPEV